MGVILHMQDKADSILPLLSMHLLTEGDESTAYSPGKAAPSGRLDREAVFPVCQLLTLFSQPFEYFFFFSNVVAFSTYEEKMILYGQPPKLCRNQLGKIFVTKIQFSNFTQTSFCQPYLFRVI